MSLIAAFLSAALMGQAAVLPVAIPQGAPAQADVPQTSSQQTTSGDPGATTVDDIEVQGLRLNEATQTFVDEITATAAAPGRGLALWRRSVCVGVINMRPEHARFMIDRVSTIAQALGVQPGEPGCKPEIIISGTTDGPGMARILIEENPQAFRPASGSTDRGSKALRAFETSTAPVRWWHVSFPVSEDTGETAIRLLGEEPPSVTVRGRSLLRSGLRDEMKRALIIVDLSRMGHADFAQLTDYVAFVALAQTDPDADTSRFSTILNLFNDHASPGGLTRWDAEYLLSLYGTAQDTTNPRFQQQAIVNRMIRQHVTPEEADAP